MASSIKAIKERVSSMESTFKERGWSSWGKDIKDYLVPDRGRFLDGDNDQESSSINTIDRDHVIDDTGEQSLIYLVSGFMSMLVPETSEWMKLRINDPSFSENRRVKMWLDDVTSLIMRVFSNSNIYSVLSSTFTEFCSFSTAAQLIDSDEIDTIRPMSFTFGEYFFRLGPDGKPNTFAYKSWWTPKQLEEKFGKDRLSQSTKNLLGGSGVSDNKILVWHLIEPNDGRTGGIKNPAGLPYNSIYFESNAPDSQDYVLKIGGYDEFPAQLPGWARISNDEWGKEGPGMRQLANIKMLQRIVESRLIVTERIGDPPMYSSGDFNQINNLPGGISYGMDAVGGRPAVQPLFGENYNPNIAALLESEERTRELIKSGFFADLFLAIQSLQGDRRTATEIIQRNEEKFAMLAPVLNKVFNELLKPMIDRTFNILMRQGFFAEDGDYPLPPELSGRDIDIEFVSVLALAQKAVGLNNVDRFLERIGMLANMFGQDALDGVDVDDIIDLYGQNVPARILVDIEERIAARQQRALQQQAIAQMAAVESAAESSEKLSKAQLGNNSMLDELAAEEG